MSGKISIVSIGGGWVVNHRHIPALQRSGLFDVVGVISKHEERARATARRFGIPRFACDVDFTKDWQAGCDAVMIGAIPHAHYEIAKAALNAGKHVLTEKPMTVDPAHAVELGALAKSRGRVLAVVHNFQFARASQRLRQDLATGRLGRIKTVYGVQLCNHARNIPAWCDQLPLGLFYDEAPHFYYMLRWLGQGELTLLNATVWKSQEPGRNTPRVVSGEYLSEKGYPLYLHINFESSLTEWHISVVGEKGVVDLDIWRDIYVFLPNDGVHTAKDITMTTVRGVAQHLWGVWTGGWRYVAGRHLYGNLDVVTNFYRAIHGENSLSGMNAAEGCRVVEHQHELIAKARYY